MAPASLVALLFILPLLFLLDLTANALRCDCELRFLTNLAETVARSGNRLDIPDVRCAEPDDLRGKLLSRVGADLARKCGDSDGGNSGK